MPEMQQSQQEKGSKLAQQPELEFPHILNRRCRPTEAICIRQDRVVRYVNVLSLL